LKVDNKEQSVSNYNSIGNTYEKLGNPQKAVQALEMALKISDETGSLAMKKVCLWNLASVYKSVGDYEKALTYYEQAAVIKDRSSMKKRAAR
jgi:tetratricopeptide (TPR) repeat protein